MVGVMPHDEDSGWTGTHPGVSGCEIAARPGEPLARGGRVSNPPALSPAAQGPGAPNIGRSHVTATRKRAPTPGMYGPNRDGLLDPDRATVQDRATKSSERLAAEKADKYAISPVIRQLRAVSAKVFRGSNG
jgi:hypothetical protein